MSDNISPDNTSTNGRISAGQTVSGELESVGDQDWYAVSLTAGTEYTIDLTSSDVDSYLYLMNSSGTQISSDDDSGGNLNSQIVYTPTSSGTYYLVSDSFSNSDIGSYQLSISAGSTPTPTTSDDYINGTRVSGGDAGDSTGSAEVVTLDSNGDASITGSISGDNDCYQFTAAGTGTATIDLTGLTDRVYMRLHDSNGSQLTSTSQTEESSKSISYDVVAGQSYIVKVDPYSSAASNYDLSIDTPTAGSTASAQNFFVSNAISVEDWLPEGVNNISGNSSIIEQNLLIYTIFLDQPASQNYSFNYELTFPDQNTAWSGVHGVTSSNDILGATTGTFNILQGSRTAQVSFAINADNLKEDVEYAQLNVTRLSDGITENARGWIIDNDWNLNDVEGLYSTNLTNATDFAVKNYYSSYIHNGIDVNGPTNPENNLHSPVLGVVTDIQNVAIDQNYGNISVLLPSLFSPNGENYYMTFLHATASDLTTGSLIGSSSILGDFNPPDYADHMHIEVKGSDGVAGWVTTSGTGTTVATDDTNIANLAMKDLSDPKPFISISQNMAAWQQSDAIPLGAFGTGSPNPSGAFSYMDTLSASDSTDRLIFFLTETKNVAIRTVWNNDGDNIRELNHSIVNQTASSSANGVDASWSPGASEQLSSGEFVVSSYTQLEPGRYEIEITGVVTAESPYWLNINFF